LDLHQEQTRRGGVHCICCLFTGSLGSQSNSTKAGLIVLAVRRGRRREVEDLQSVVRGGPRSSARQIPRRGKGRPSSLSTHSFPATCVQYCSESLRAFSRLLFVHPVGHLGQDGSRGLGDIPKGVIGEGEDKLEGGQTRVCRETLILPPEPFIYLTLAK
jgi:hypothetical protein